jgi:hypothetical protein
LKLRGTAHIKQEDTMKTLICEIYDVYTDFADWPLGLTDEYKRGLCIAVREVLEERHPKVEPWVKKDIRWEWRMACVDRACRHLDADKRWVLVAKED